MAAQTCQYCQEKIGYDVRYVKTESGNWGSLAHMFCHMKHVDEADG